jgi:hypothetical protein
MRNRVLVLGLLGPLALIGGCASWFTGCSTCTEAPAGGAAKPTDLAKAQDAAQTKQVTLSVPGMT